MEKLSLKSFKLCRALGSNINKTKIKLKNCSVYSFSTFSFQEFSQPLTSLNNPNANSLNSHTNPSSIPNPHHHGNPPAGLFNFLNSNVIQSTPQNEPFTHNPLNPYPGPFSPSAKESPASSSSPSNSLSSGLGGQSSMLEGSSSSAASVAPSASPSASGSKRSSNPNPNLNNSRAFKAPIQLTEAAAERIKHLLNLQNDVLGIRVSVTKKGCSGMAYKISYVGAADKEKFKFDPIVNQHGVKVWVDPKAELFIAGTTMDYIDTDLSSEFVFINPREKGKCGCGKSFTV